MRSQALRVRPAGAAALCAMAMSAATVAACTPSGTPSALPSSGSPQSSGVFAAPGVRWWSNGAAGSGSTIDPADPTAAAEHLSPSATQYCAMLRQTVVAGKSVLRNVTANDPALVTSTRAFVAELEAVAPASIAGSWRVLGPVVITLVESGGDLASVKRVDAAVVRKAASTVAADAKHSCGVDLS